MSVAIDMNQRGAKLVTRPLVANFDADIEFIVNLPAEISIDFVVGLAFIHADIIIRMSHLRQLTFFRFSGRCARHVMEKGDVFGYHEFSHFFGAVSLQFFDGQLRVRFFDHE